MGVYFRNPEQARAFLNSPLGRVILWLFAIGMFAMLALSAPSAVMHGVAMAALQSDPSCTADLGAASRPTGACTVSDVKIASGSLQLEHQTISTGRSVTSTTSEHYFVTVTLPGQAPRDIEVKQDLYDASLFVPSSPAPASTPVSSGFLKGFSVDLGPGKPRALLYKGAIVRLALGDTSSDTADNPGWNFVTEIVVAFLGLVGVLLVLNFVLRSWRKGAA